MSSNGLEVFDRTIQETNIWLGEIAGDLGSTGKSLTGHCAPRFTPFVIV
jgi:hypothetical protein